VSIVATLSEQKAAGGLSFVARSSDINATVIDDTVVQKNCSLHIRGNLLASLTIEPGAKVVVEGSVEGRIVNKGGRLLVNNKAHASCITAVGPAEDEARGILKIDLTAVVSNWERLAKFSTVECAAGLEGNAYGCGIEPIAGALARNGCKTFFVSDIPEARRVRAVAPSATVPPENTMVAPRPRPMTKRSGRRLFTANPLGQRVDRGQRYFNPDDRASPDGPAGPISRLRQPPTWQLRLPC